MDDDDAVRFFRFHAETHSASTPGRMLQKVRQNNFVIDDPDRPAYGGPGESPNAGEYFLSGITGCAGLMMERIAREESLPLERVVVAMDAAIDTSITERSGPPVFDEASMLFTFWGLTDEQAGQLVETFKGR